MHLRRVSSPVISPVGPGLQVLSLLEFRSTTGNTLRAYGWRRLILLMAFMLWYAAALCGCGAHYVLSASQSGQMTVSVASLNFGSVLLATSSSKALTLTSSGTAALTINSVTLAGTGFTMPGASFPITLNPGQSLTLQVSFDPAVAGAASGAITISSNSSSAGTTTVALSGTGTAALSPQLTVSAASISFGSVPLNTTSTKALALTSSGTAALTINSVTLAGTGFTMSGASFPTTLNPGQSVMLQISFDPAVVGAASGSIRITSNSSSAGTTTVALSGTGTAALSPQLTVSATSISFGSVPLNTTSTKALALTSSGTAALTINSVTLAGAGFTMSGTSFPTTLNPGQSVTLQVSFDPVVAGAASGAITISSNSSSAGTTTVALSGTGTAALSPQLTVSAGSISFGSVPLNTTSTKALTLTSSGTAALTINSVTLAGAGFTMSGASFPTTLNPGQSVTLQLSFDPVVAGAAGGSIRISSNSSSAGTTTVALSGTGTSPANRVLSLSTTSLSFGNDPVGTPVAQPVTLTSTGTSPVTVNTGTITGAGFTFSGAVFPVTLSPASAITVQVQFNPAVVGAASGMLTFSSDSSTGGTSVVNLTGNGTAVQHRVNLSWNPPANSPVTVVDYNIYRATGSSSSYQQLNSTSTVTYVDLAVQANTTYTYYVTSVGSDGIESVPSNPVTVTIPK